MPKCCEPMTPMRDRGTIQQDSRARHDPQPDYTGTPFATNIPGNITTVSGDETFRGRQLDARVSHVIEIRYRSGVSPTMRWLGTGGIYKDRTLHIWYVKPVRKVGKPPMLWLYCEELPD